MKTQEIILTENEKRAMKPLVIDIAGCAFDRASEMLMTAKKKMWKVMCEKHPEAIRFDHPDDGDWVVVLREENKDK